tara:strand:+ start:476 stop:586 length:111 start_codon:yes stop_codon:yes gene_type:complete
MASVKQRIETLRGWLAFMEASKKRKTSNNSKTRAKR